MGGRSFQPAAPGVEQSLGKLQAAIMETLWVDGSLSVRALHQKLSERSPLAYTTVFTELSRMLAKKLVRKEGTRLETRYAPVPTREEFIEQMIASVIGGLVDAHGPAAIHGFVEIVARDDASLAALRSALRRKTGGESSSE